MINPTWDGVSLLSKYTYLLVPCGKCLACRVNRRREWTARLQQEIIYSSSAIFLTLTYSDEHLPLDENSNPCVSKRDVQLFLKRLRKHYGPGIRHFLNSEYGPETHRPHYHAIIYNLPSTIFEESKQLVRYSGGRKSFFYLNDTITSLWGNGNCEFSEVTKERCGYCAKYFVSRQDVPENYKPNFSLMSKGRRSIDGIGGIGYRYSQAIADKVIHSGSISMLSPSSGRPVALPRYYRDCIFTVEEKQRRTQDYLDSYEVTPEYLKLIEEHKTVEANQYRSMTFKNIKSKI